LLVHGFAQNRLAYVLGAVPAALAARGARVILGELRGHGLSEHPTDQIDHEATLAHHLNFDYPALLSRAQEIGGVSTVHLVGHSMGGMLGYGLLARAAPLASLTTFGSPVTLGTGRPLLRLASLVALPVLSLSRRRSVPMDRLLRLVSSSASRPVRRGPIGLIRNQIRLANPAEAPLEVIAAILGSGHPVAPGVFRDMARLAKTRGRMIDGTDMVEAARQAKIPVAAVIGGHDVFAPRSSVAPLEVGAGPRRIIELPDAAHVDLTMGIHSERVVDELWPFLLRA